MPWATRLLIVLGTLLGGWLIFDGSRALVVGDYVTPQTGKYAGQLGPWSLLTSAVGLDPRSTTVKLAHVVLGAAWLLAIASLRFRRSWSRQAVIGCAVASLWYLPIGTLVGVIALVCVALTRKAPRRVEESVDRGQ